MVGGASTLSFTWDPDDQNCTDNSAARCIFHVVCTEIKIYGMYSPSLIGGHMYTACVTTYPVGMVTYTCT